MGASETTYDEIRMEVIARRDLTPEQREDVLEFIRDFRIQIGAQVVDSIVPDRLRELVRISLT